ncbi:hypothetical protein ACLOJK_029009 [Asimina triloba]
MERFVAVFVAFLLVISQIGCGFSSPMTVPAFLWSSRHEGWLLGDSKEVVAYEVLSPKDLAKTVLSRGGWANILCSGRNTEHQLKSSHLVRKRHADQGLIELLKMLFITSNFSMAFPYVAVSEENETMENALVSVFTESCQNQLDVNDIAFLESCSVEGEDLKKLRGLDVVHEYVGSWMQRKQKGKTDLIVFCSQGSSVYEGSGQIQSEGEIFSELIASLKESSATYTVLYASDQYNSLDYSSLPALKRFLAESSSGVGNSTHCDRTPLLKRAEKKILTSNWAEKENFDLNWIEEGAVVGFSSLPKHCLTLCYVLFFSAILINAVRDLLGGNAFAPAVASGLICGDGKWTLPQSILSLAQVTPPICMRFLSRSTKIPVKEHKCNDGSMASDKFQKSYFDVLVIVVHDNLLISQIQIETLQRYATMRSKEAMSLIGNKHKRCLGGPDIMVAEVGSLDTSNDEVVGISFAGLSMLVLEAVAFGSFLGC